MRMIVRYLSRCGAVFATLCTTACSDGERLVFEKEAEDGGIRPAGVQSISVLKSLYHDRSTRIVQDISIQGCIVANDDAGEFYKRIVIEDDTGGIVVCIDGEKLYRRYRLFDFATINCRQLALGSEGGTLSLGVYPTGEYAVDRIPPGEDSRYISVTQAAARREPQTLAFDALAPRHISRYVRFDDVCFAESGCTWCDFDPETGEALTTDRTLVDAEGRRLCVRTDRRCEYAAERLPAGRLSVCGIVEYFGGAYRLRVTHREVVPAK